MSYLIFMKRLEDMGVLEERRRNANGQAYVSTFEGHEECKWSKWKHKSAEEMMKHVRDIVFPFIKNIHDGEKTLFSQHMKDAVFIIPKPSLVQEAVGIINEFDISGQTSDVQGDIYEYLLSQLATAGKNGQFRTPRHIIRMIVELVDPGVNDRICDPECGTAGFLFTVYRYILRKYTSSDMVKEDEEGDWHNLIGNCITEQEAWDKLHQDIFYGFDFDSTMVRIALMNMVLHGIKAPHIESTDALSNQYSGEKEFTVILANPPFKGSIDKNDINERLTLNTIKTKLLFVETMYGLLEIGGKCGVIVPDSVLFGISNAHKNLRKLLLEKCQLEGIISMPSGVFKLYAGVSTAVLIFTKGGRTGKVWFYDMEADGYFLDDKRTPTDLKGDVPDIIERFRKRREGKKNPPI
jgi:type I restriction enzyme M protein